MEIETHTETGGYMAIWQQRGSKGLIHSRLIQIKLYRRNLNWQLTQMDAVLMQSLL